MSEENGLKSIAPVEVRNETQVSREKKEIAGESQKMTFGAMLKARWSGWRDVRRPQEDQWLANMRQFHSEYETEVINAFKAGRSKTFVGITRMKTMVAFSKLVEVFYPASGNKHWDIDPTPEPTISNQIEEAPIATGVPDSPQQAKQEDPAEAASKAMKRRIADQLEEADYDVLLLEALLECTILGSGCLKSTSAKIERDFGWIKAGDEDGKVWQFLPRESDSIKPQVEAPSVFDVYPDPHASSIDSANGCFQRHVFNKHEFRNLKLLAEFKADEIDDYLEKYPDGDHTDESHEIERRRLGKNVYSLEENLRYDVFEYWGWVDGTELRRMGIDISEEGLSQEYMANVWLVGSTPIKVVLDESTDERINFFIFPYEKVPKRIFGRGVPEIMADSQETLNAAGRRLQDDVALLGPQIEINTDDLDTIAIKNIDDIYPFKVWPRSGGDSHDPMLRVHNLNTVSKELIEIMTIWRRFIDEETNLPTPFSGNGKGGGGGRETVGGTKLVMNAANVVGRSIVKNIDKFAIKPFITKLYNFNMQWSDDEEIKGDQQVSASGSTILIEQEMQTTQMINLLNITNNPTDIALTKRENMLRKVAENSGIKPDFAVKSKEEIQALANDPVKQQLDQNAVQKSVLENQEVAARIDKEQSEVRKNDAAIKNDEELMRLKSIELRGKEIEAAAMLALKQKEVDANINALASKPVAGQKKTTVGTTRDTSKNDGLKSNNE
jgi:hypothetical protein